MPIRLRFADAWSIMSIEWFHMLWKAVRLALILTVPRGGTTVEYLYLLLLVYYINVFVTYIRIKGAFLHICNIFKVTNIAALVIWAKSNGNYSWDNVSSVAIRSKNTVGGFTTSLKTMPICCIQSSRSWTTTGWREVLPLRLLIPEVLVVSATVFFNPQLQIHNGDNLPFWKLEKHVCTTMLLGISSPIHVRIQFEPLHGPIEFVASVSAPQTATAHMESLLCIPTIAICCRTPRAASAWRIRTS